MQHLPMLQRRWRGRRLSSGKRVDLRIGNLMCLGKKMDLGIWNLMCLGKMMDLGI